MIIIDKEQHERALGSSRDVPEESPSFPIRLSAVGITNKTLWIQLPQGTLPFDCSLQVDLPASARGIHMSRMENAISSLHGRSFPDIRAYASSLACSVLDTQSGTRAKVELSGQLPVETRTRVTNNMSIDMIEVGTVVDAWMERERIMMLPTLTVGMYHMTACPCTQVYAEHLFQRRPDPLPLFTHTQRSLTSLSIEDGNDVVSYDELVGCLNTALHATQDLLKRPDEAEIVLRVHQNPQFAEDSVREVAKRAGIYFGKRLSASTRLRISSLSMESIHIHDVRCELDTTMGHVLDVLKGQGMPDGNGSS